MDNLDKNILRLNKLLGAARNVRLPDDLTQRMLADAQRVQADWLIDGAAGAESERHSAPGIWPHFLGVLGGWPSLGGLVTACAAGLWIGLAPPSFLPDPAQLVLGGQDDLDLIGMDTLAFLMLEDG